MLEDKLREALTFDDVLLVPAFSEIIPRDVDVATRLTPAIPLRMPLVSSAMDTVTESATAIRMAREGGMGFIHKNLTIEDQAREVSRVKKAQSGIVVDRKVLSDLAITEPAAFQAIAEKAKASEGKQPDLAKLLGKGQTWTVSENAADPV